jgi:PAS domain S-box-containing protein
MTLISSIPFNVRVAHLMSRLALLALLLVLCLIVGSAPLRAQSNVTDANKTVTIGVIAHRGVDKAVKMWAPTVDYLNQAIPDQTFEMLPVLVQDLLSVVSAGKVDFVIVNPGAFVELETQFGIAPIATLVKRSGGKTSDRFGGVVFTRADNAAIRTIEDLRGRSFAAVSPKSFGGYQMAWREFQAIGLDVAKDFSESLFTGFPQDKVVRAVLEGRVDAGNVRTGVLESMAAEGEINLSDIRILLFPNVVKFPLSLSTRLYPEWSFARLRPTSMSLSGDVITALLKITPDSDPARLGRYHAWSVSSSYVDVKALMQELQIGPFAGSRVSKFQDILTDNWRWLSGITVFVFFAALVVSFKSEILGRSKSGLTNRGRLGVLTLSMVCVVIVVLAVTCTFLYRVSVDEQRQELHLLARSQAALIDAVARYDVQHSHSDHSGDAAAATMIQVQDGFDALDALGTNEELIIVSRSQNGFVVDMTSHGRDGHSQSHPSHLEMTDGPAHRALRGLSGVMRYTDAGGHEFWAAYEPIPTLGKGIIAQTGIDVIRAPYVSAVFLSSVVALFAIIGAVLVFRRVSSPLINRLELSVRGLANAQRLAKVGNWEWNIKTGNLHWSDEIYRIFGQEPQSFAATYEAFLETIHPEDREAVQSAVGGAIEEDGQYEIEHRIIMPDEEVRDVLEKGEVSYDPNGQPAMMLGTVHDITSRKRAELQVKELNENLERLVDERTQALQAEVDGHNRTQEMLHRSEERNRSIVNTAADGIITINEQGHVTSFNNAAQSIFGWSVIDILGQNISVLMPKPDSDHHDQYLQNYMRTFDAKIIGTGREVEGLRKDGTTFPMDLSVSVTELEDGLLFTGIVRDISERKAADEELRRTLDTLQKTQNELVQVEKMASLGSLVAGVAHEINTPVGIGVTAASYLKDASGEIDKSFKDGAITKSKLAKFIDTAEQSTTIILTNLARAADLIRSFKQVAVDQSSSKPRRFNIGPYLDEVLVSLRPQLKRTQHSVTVECDPGIELNNDPGALAQVVTNLVMNSMIHGFEGVKHGAIKMKIVEEGDSLIFEYSDSGRGMDEETRKKVFDPFFTTRRGTGGSGLGMNIVFNLVTQTLGGSISCESAVGDGATFTMTFPRDIAQAA